ncbi:hypothetical protein, conserved [Thermococcus kodakarensis KOD1]|uniref:Uncharacterized protein n=1 Tax=Thermococcus kodakarensis (strain ATCC BAA-918 / JCM 12380 / KOD1) TaxID=69014 RepID=Q5JD79_THEKO|nr:hypothetical protein [Thermococcus kodakarensis]WCN28548.1 hypothetical protein POG15_02505 [Thermococcus kodakarensis]WCN30845.1 hypothetical protein POG21_02505 [Thermococcus kodakarensis]BAD84678.1 hypothetical protein, conserved [Thermococcus kodakarensis KOD1]
MWITIQGKHLTIKIDLDRYIPSPYPFFLIFGIKDNLIVGACWKGKLEGAETNVYGVLQELLIACIQMLNPKSSTSNFARKEAKWHGFVLNENNPSYELITSSNPSSILYFEADGNILKVYYYNDLLAYTNCREYENRHRGVVELPLREFVEDVLKISREYLEKYASIIEKIRLEHGEEPDDYDSLRGLYREVERLYRESGFR